MIDERPKNRRAIEVAAELARADHGKAAAVIRDLVDLAQAYERLIISWGLGSYTAITKKDLDTMGRLKWRIE